MKDKNGKWDYGEWFVYIHERNHMVLNSQQNFGNYYSYTTLPDNSTYVKVHEINRKEVTYLNDPRTPCLSKAREEGMNKCIQHYIEKEIGCRLPWNNGKTQLPRCIEKEQYQSFLDTSDKISRLSGFSIAKKTGCLPSCKIYEYTMEILDLINLRNGIAIFEGYFYFPGGQYWQKVYHYNYDFTSYIADVGGLVGLFLGFSMLGFYDGLKNAYKSKRLW